MSGRFHYASPLASGPQGEAARFIDSRHRQSEGSGPECAGAWRVEAANGRAIRWRRPRW